MSYAFQMPTVPNSLPTLHTNLWNRLRWRERTPCSSREISLAMPFKVQVFISPCEIKSGIHEPRIGNAVPAGDAGECDTPAKVRLNNEMCHFVPCSPTATGTSFVSIRPVWSVRANAVARLVGIFSLLHPQIHKKSQKL